MFKALLFQLVIAPAHETQQHGFEIQGDNTFPHP